MNTRRDWKKAAKKTVKSHYWLLLLVCLAACLMGTEFTRSLDFMEVASNLKGSVDSSDSSTMTFGFEGIYEAVLNNTLDKQQAAIEKKLDDAGKEDSKIGAVSLGHTRGVLAGIVNMTKSGGFFMMLIATISSIVGSEEISGYIVVLLTILFYALIWIFLLNIYHVVYRRIAMEARVYKHVPLGRFLFLVRVKRWTKVTGAMFRAVMYELLWGLTIIGGFIKHYSYLMVPYILAENPDLDGKTAIKMSRNMMNGHKLDAFVLDLTMLGWDALGIVTLGLSDLFFANAYKCEVYCEYYTYLRKLAKEKELKDAELLNDEWLYKIADKELLDQTYPDIKYLEKGKKIRIYEGKPVRRFLAEVFGIVLDYDEEERKYREQQVREGQINSFKKILDGESYPSRLFPIPEKEKIASLENTGYLRFYSLLSLISIFFTACIGGWIFEVSQVIIKSGEFHNRGVLHGPWLPIYGIGGILMLVLLNKARKKPALLFVLSVILAGVVEYYTAWSLEMKYNGQKWWDYSGYFLNLHGRICAEGLFVFGLGGLAVVYLLGPAIDNQIRKIPRKVLLPICVTLVLLFCADQIYSSTHPNEGEGITDIGGSSKTSMVEYEPELLQLEKSKIIFS